jgi:hypothetical protein
MLREQGRAIRKFSSLRVVVSDSASMLVHLPWQDELRGRDEIHAYALACFAHQGAEPGTGWEMRPGFRTFRGAGVAYALRQDWLSALSELARSHGLRLCSVLPASAAAYWYSRTPRKDINLVLLTESTRITAHVYHRRRLLTVDVQPIMADLTMAGIRLLKRVAVIYPDIAQVQYWQATPMVAAGEAGFITTCLPGAKVRRAEYAWGIR